MLAPFDPDQLDAAHLVQSDLAGRRILIVTAPFGAFGRTLARALEARGAEVRRMIFNAGDLTYWRRPGGVRFNADARSWPLRLGEMARDYTDILVFGEGGAYNQGVLSQASRLPAKVWVLENGYFRPDWITLERNGVNASSALPRSAEGYEPPIPELPVTRPVGKMLPHHVINITLYHLIQALGSPVFPRYTLPYTVSPWRQCLGHVRRYVRLVLQPKSETDVELISQRGPFFIACLQREGDVQLLRYSAFADNMAFLAKVMNSFARHAPPEARLVVKNHPLDPGLVDLAHLTRVLAIERGIADRVDFVDGGNLAQMCRASLGMVVNNSSAALSALGFSTPVKVLGRAFFDFEGLTDQQPLDGFWNQPKPADKALFARFRAHVIRRSQINGNYHEPRAMKHTAAAVAAAIARRP